MSIDYEVLGPPNPHLPCTTLKHWARHHKVLVYTEKLSEAYIVSGHLELNHTITKEVMFCIKERHQEELNTTTKGPKS